MCPRPAINKVNRTVQAVPQSRSVAKPGHQEEEKNYKNQHMHEMHKDQLSLFHKRGDHNAKRTEKTTKNVRKQSR